jgi:hypothetical protein
MCASNTQQKNAISIRRSWRALFEVLKMTTATLEGAHQMIAAFREFETLGIVRRQIRCS